MKRDPNHVPPIMLYNETTGLVEPARCNPADDSLLIDVYYTDVLTPTAVNVSPRDGNHVPTWAGYNETTGMYECYRCDDRGYLYVLLES